MWVASVLNGCDIAIPLQESSTMLQPSVDHPEQTSHFEEWCAGFEQFRRRAVVNGMVKSYHGGEGGLVGGRRRGVHGSLIVAEDPFRL